MAVVKGSKQEKMIVVPYRPMRSFFVRLGVLLCTLLVGGGFYLLGHNKGVDENIDARAERDQLLLDLEASTFQLSDLRQQVINHEQAIAVDRQSLENVQESIFSLREKNAQLEEDVLFYQQIMSPENGETGMIVGGMDLIATGIEGIIRYRLELKQVANNDRLVTGHVNVNILGMQDQQEVSLPLRSLSLNEEQIDIKLQFRYFQNIEGELVLPDGFEPEKIQILAVGEGKSSKTIQKSFGWVVRS